MLRSICLSAFNAGHISVNFVLNRLSTPVLVLIFHRVTTLEHDPQMLAVKPENFREQLQVLKRYPILRFEEPWNDVREPSVVLTFDDGYADNFLEALPILEEYDVPATFFINIEKIGTLQEFWWDELERLLLAPGGIPDFFTLEGKDGNHVNRWETVNHVDRHKLYRDLHRMILRSRDSGFGTKVIDQLRRWRGFGSEGRATHRILSESELKQLAAHPLATIGAHAISHVPLSSLSMEQQQFEVARSKTFLEQVTDRNVPVFSYPFGTRKDYSRQTALLVKEAGFHKAAANFPGRWYGWTDNFQVPRQLVRNWDKETFATRLRWFWLL